MRITDLRTVLLTGSSGNDPYLKATRKVRSAAFVEVHTDTDLVGIGETYLGYHAPEIVPAIVEFFKPILVGVSDGEIDPPALWRRMYRCANFWARNGAGAVVLAGIEGALWDLRGKMEGAPVHRLLGGPRHDRLLGYATGSHSNYPWSELRRKIDLYRAAGFRAFKVAAGWHNAKTGEGFQAADISAWVEMESEKLRVIRDHAGDDFVVCLDGHMSNVDEGMVTWNVEMAGAILKALEPFGVFFYEEPLHYNDLAGYAELCRRTAIPVAGGECLTTREEFALYAEREAFDIAQPDASFIGIGAFLDVARMFSQRGRRVATHAWSSGAGVMENIHAAFASADVAILETPPLAGGLHTDIYAPGYRFRDGYILPPEAPGLGVTLTDEIKSRYPFIPGSGEWNQVPGKGRVM